EVGHWLGRQRFLIRHWPIWINAAPPQLRLRDWARFIAEKVPLPTIYELLGVHCADGFFDYFKRVHTCPCALTPKLSRDAQFRKAHGKLYLPCALRNEAASA